MTTTAVSRYAWVGGGPAIRHVVDQLYTWILAAAEDTLLAVRPDVLG
ncbi:hypothetical protein [Dactylosporangium sp. NPDC000521]